MVELEKGSLKRDGWQETSLQTYDGKGLVYVLSYEMINAQSIGN